MSATYSVGGLGGSLGAGGGVQQIMALRNQIIQRNDLLKQLHQNQATGLTGSVTDTSAATPASSATGGGFTDALKSALDGVNASQTKADDLSDAYDRGEVTDTAKVMLARQEASVSFEATLQVRNKLLSAYQDIMRMGV